MFRDIVPFPSPSSITGSIFAPRPYIVGTITETFEKYPNIGVLLPAMGYGAQQVKDMEETINATPCDAVVIGTPIDLRQICNIKHPSTRVKYELKEVGDTNLEDVLKNI